MVLGLPSVPSRRREAICSSSAFPTLVSSSFVHAAEPPELFSLIGGNVLPLGRSSFCGYPHGVHRHGGRSVTTRERASAPVRKALPIQVLIDPPNFSGVAE